MRPVQVVGVRVELPANHPVVLLKESDGTRYLAIWIGAAEASAIAFHQQGITSARPLTHDLLRDVLTAVHAQLTEVRITEFRDDIFFADLVLGDGSTVSARPSDAIALALRTESPIVADEAVLDAVGITIGDGDGDTEADLESALAGASGVTQEREVEEFREFLDTISPDDFAAEGGAPETGPEAGGPAAGGPGAGSPEAGGPEAGGPEAGGSGPADGDDNGPDRRDP